MSLVSFRDHKREMWRDRWPDLSHGYFLTRWYKYWKFGILGGNVQHPEIVTQPDPDNNKITRSVTGQKTGLDPSLSFYAKHPLNPFLLELHNPWSVTFPGLYLGQCSEGSESKIFDPGKVSYLWVRKFPLKTIKFVSLRVKKISSGWVKKYPGQRRVDLSFNVGQKYARVKLGHG